MQLTWCSYRCCFIPLLTSLLLSCLLISSAWGNNYYPINPTVSDGAIFIAENGISYIDTTNLQVRWTALVGLNSDAPVVPVYFHPR